VYSILCERHTAECQEGTTNVDTPGLHAQHKIIRLGKIIAVAAGQDKNTWQAVYLQSLHDLVAKSIYWTDKIEFAAAAAEFRAGADLRDLRAKWRS
jgi:hypothetical protein